MEPSGEELVLQPGTVIGERYRVVRELGRGGMGAVFAAEHVSLRRRVALKVLLPEIASQGEIVERFLREARAAAAIGHPGIVEVFDLGSHALPEGGAMPYLAMEQLEGEELADRIEREHPLAFRETVRIGVELCDALAAAHEAGIVHRDLKPQNVFLAKDKRGGPALVKVLDFGIAKLLDTAEGSLTETGRVFGTPRYMAPEQLRSAARADARSDVYAIGVILFEMITGRPPFLAESFVELVLQITNERVPAPSEMRARVPPKLEALVIRAMARDPAERFQSARALGEALAEVGRGLDAIALDATLGSEPPPPTRSASAPRPSGARHDDAPPALRWPWVAGALVATATGLVALAALATGGSEARAPADPPPTTHGATTSSSPPDPTVEATSASVPPQSAPPPDPPAARVAVVTTPAGAQATLGESSCATPCDLELPALPATLRITHPGYRSLERRLTEPPAQPLDLRLSRAPSHRDDPPPLRPP